MKRIIIDSVVLGSVLEEIKQDAVMLGYVNGEDDMDDVEYYAGRIKDAISDIWGLIQTAEPAEEVKQ